MNICKECKNICRFEDDTTLRKLYSICKVCNIRSDINNSCIFKKSFKNSMTLDKDNSLFVNDATLPENNVKVCKNCNSNKFVYTRNNDLTLSFICKVCYYS